MRALAGRIGRASPYLTAIIEQGLFSLLNLGVVLVLGRVMTPDQFGACVLWFSVAYVLASVQNAVSVAHLQVLPNGRGVDPARFSTERVMLGATICFWAAVAAGAAVAVALMTGDGPFGVWAAVLFTPAYLMQQYVRLTLFSRGAPGAATIQTGAVLVVATGLLALGSVVFRPLQAEAVLALMGAAYALVGLAGLAHIGKGLWRGMIAALPAYVAYSRQSGWLFLGVSSTEILARFYVFAVGAAYGPGVLAALSFSQTFLRPAPLLASSWSMAARSDLVARREAGDWGGYVRLLTLSGAAGAAFALIWAAVIWAAWPAITGLAFDGKYADARWMLPLWGVSVAFGFVQVVVSTGLQILKAFKPLAIANASASAVAAVGVLWGIRRLGPGGAILGTAAGQAMEAAAMLVVLVALIRRLRRG
ncbi:hypothetical protein SH203_00239 [Brevundimonas sp. SH203]|uniref:lipopolysaccharide biosynthesis protein n=1 Tax=Brevundimonas sp. SH203 TaxID=345167 RepID=UPI0009CBC2C3|nr:hypothetical protein [Brevundimonas sp. SH203]GAW39856.1 hypothetical protein SH203_00239 [Brevundimonas sp. SH203]